MRALPTTTAALLCLVLALPSAAVETEPLAGAARFALLVGANDGGDDRVELQYAGTDATAFDRVLRDLAGVPTTQRLVLRNPNPAALESAFLSMGEAIAEASEQGPTHFFFYYSGHSDEGGLLLAGEQLDYAQLKELIKGVPADVRVGILDSCASGALTRVKGGTHKDPFLVDGSAVKGHAFLTSSAADEAAQESDRIRGSFFTYYLVSGLRGAADINHDQKVTLNEAYRFAFDETLQRTATTVGGAQHAVYDIHLVGSGDLVITDLRNTSARLEIAGNVQGRVFIRDSAGNLEAELYKPAGTHGVILALEPDTYDIVVDEGGVLWQTQLTLVDGGGAALIRDEMTSVVAEAATARGDDDAAADVASPAPDVEVAVDRSEYRKVAFAFGLVPPLSANAVARPDKALNHASVDLLWGHGGRLDGVALSLGGSSYEDGVHGLQLATLAAASGGNMDGLQHSFGVNVVGSHLHGVQVGPGVSIVGGAADGLQIGSVAVVSEQFHGVQTGIGVNVTGERMRGVQVAGGVNIAGNGVDGLQVGTLNIDGGDLGGMQVGVINLTRGRVEGLQVGVFNWADDADAQFGLLGGTTKHGVGLTVFTSDLAMVNVGARFHARYTYTNLYAGVHPTGVGAHVMYGAGLGLHAPLGKVAAIEFDDTVHGVHSIAFVDPIPALVNTQRLMLSARVAGPLRVWGGVTFNEMIEFQPVSGPTRPGYPYYVYETRLGDEANLRLWPGFVVGVELNPAQARR